MGTIKSELKALCELTVWLVKGLWLPVGCYYLTPLLVSVLMEQR